MCVDECVCYRMELVAGFVVTIVSINCDLVIWNNIKQNMMCKHNINIIVDGKSVNLQNKLLTENRISLQPVTEAGNCFRENPPPMMLS